MEAWELCLDMKLHMALITMVRLLIYFSRCAELYADWLIAEHTVIQVW